METTQELPVVYGICETGETHKYVITDLLQKYCRRLFTSVPDIEQLIEDERITKHRELVNYLRLNGVTAKLRTGAVKISNSFLARFDGAGYRIYDLLHYSVVVNKSPDHSDVPTPKDVYEIVKISGVHEATKAFKAKIENKYRICSETDPVPHSYTLQSILDKFENKEHSLARVKLGLLMFDPLKANPKNMKDCLKAISLFEKNSISWKSAVKTIQYHFHKK